MLSPTAGTTMGVIKITDKGVRGSSRVGRLKSAIRNHSLKANRLQHRLRLENQIARDKNRSVRSVQDRQLLQCHFAINFQKTLDFKLSGLLRTQAVAKLGNLAGPGFRGFFVEILGALGRCDSLTFNNFEAMRGLLWFSEIMFLIEPTSPQVVDRSVFSKLSLLALGVRTNGSVLRTRSGLSQRVRRILNEAIDSTGR